MITSTYSPTQEVLEYALEHASIFHVQKLYQVYYANSIKRDYFYKLVLLKCIFFTPDKVNGLPFFDLHAAQQADINICINHLQVVRFFLDMFQTYLA